MAVVPATIGPVLKGIDQCEGDDGFQTTMDLSPLDDARKEGGDQSKTQNDYKKMAQALDSEIAKMKDSFRALKEMQEESGILLKTSEDCRSRSTLSLKRQRQIQSLTDKIEDIRAQVRAIENASDLQERAVRVEYQRNRNLKEKLHQVEVSNEEYQERIKLVIQRQDQTLKRLEGQLRASRNAEIRVQRVMKVANFKQKSLKLETEKEEPTRSNSLYYDRMERGNAEKASMIQYRKSETPRHSRTRPRIIRHAAGRSLTIVPPSRRRGHSAQRPEKRLDFESSAMDNSNERKTENEDIDKKIMLVDSVDSADRERTVSDIVHGSDKKIKHETRGSSPSHYDFVTYEDSIHKQGTF
eukprot:jgi/Bigna1/142019/aug1.66_g16727